MSSPQVYLNGQFLPLDRAQVSVLDRGFLLGDGIYEVIPAYAGAPFRLDEHLERLEASLAAIRLPNPHTQAEWREIITRLIQCQEGASDLSIYLQITRGAALKRDHAFPAQTQATVFLMATPFEPPPPEQKRQGIAAVTLDDIRWRLCNIKAITLLPNVLLRQQAIDAGAAEAILIRDGQATEGAASNLFMVRNGAIITPPKGPTLLPGITRDLVLELAQQAGLEAREAPIYLAELRSSDEVWLSSSTKEVLPVTQLDGQAVGQGHPGPLWQRMDEIYQAFKAQLSQPA